MDELARIRTRLALEDLNTAFTYHLDHNRIDDLVALFTEDAIYTHDTRRSQGRQQIRALFVGRTATKIRTARHLYTGLRIHIEGELQATGTSVCMTFASDGPPPIQPATPYLVADFEDRYRLCADGQWRIEARHIRRIFAAADNPGPIGVERGPGGPA
jgi:ketosteroid isomerase-like protein